MEEYVEREFKRSEYNMRNEADKNIYFPVPDRVVLSLFEDCHEIKSLLKRKLYECLNKQAKQFTLVSIQNIRGIGKTTALIEFAKENDFYVVVANYQTANSLRKQFNYDKIIGQREVRSGRNLKYVVDEDVVIDDLIDKNINIVAGFVSNYKLIF
jgi:hypothetical protein